VIEEPIMLGRETKYLSAEKELNNAVSVSAEQNFHANGTDLPVLFCAG
jgi:hypothetical protein